MRAAILLRLREAARRGGLLFLALAALAVALTARLSDGGYAVASDVAAVLGYSLALFLGAFALPSDRERRRAHVPAASPVPRWRWTLGNAAGTAAAAGVAALSLFAAAAAGAAGLEARETSRPDPQGTLWLTGPRRLAVPGDATAVRLPLRAVPVQGGVEGTPDLLAVRVQDAIYHARIGRTLVAPVSPDRPVVLGNATEGVHVGVDTAGLRVLRRARDPVANALLAGLGPALAAAAFAALATAAGAHMGGGVAALACGCLLVLAALRGVLLDALEGAAHRAEAPPPPAAARVVFRLLPDLDSFDRTDAVAAGEWTGGRGARDAAPWLLGALALAALAGLPRREMLQ